MPKLDRDSVLIIGDLHAPFEHRSYLEFVKEIQKRCKCKTVISIGDLVDNSSISYWEKDADAMSPADEMNETDKHLTKWFKAFKDGLLICRGNHDVLVDRKRRTANLPSRCFKPFRDIWNLPKNWHDDFEWIIDGVLYKHGTGMSGKYAHVQAAERARMSTVIGHTHSSGGVEYMVSEKDKIFGMQVGCGINRKALAFAYGKDFPRKPVLGCGVVTDKGKFAQFFPMDL